MAKFNEYGGNIRLSDIIEKLTCLCSNLDRRYVDPKAVASQVIEAIQPEMCARRINEMMVEIAASMAIEHPDYDRLAARIRMTQLHEETPRCFSAAMTALHRNNVLNARFYECVCRHAEFFDAAIEHQRDFEQYDYLAIKTLERSYLLGYINDDGERILIERPQYLMMRVAVAIHGDDLLRVFNSYDLMSRGFFTHASPALFSAGTRGEAFSSCYLLTIVSDSIDGIFETVRRCAQVSKAGGGVGLNISNVRAQGTPIVGTCGTSNGIVPMIRVFNNTARYVDQGGGRRLGAFTIYLEPWHPDIFAFLKLCIKTGVEEERARDVFLAVWMCDLLMQRIEKDELWSLMCPHRSPGLIDLWGEDFKKKYLQYEAEGRYVRRVPARDILQAILTAQMETGMPFILHKDHCNRRSNQMHLGTLRGSNLCTEIVQYTSADEVAVCNLASIALPRFIDKATGRFDFCLLRKIVQTIVRNLDRTIDIPDYALPQARYSNMRHRPMGIGVQGLADVFAMMKISWTRWLNRRIFEIIYRAALETSCELAREHGAPYDSYPGSPASKRLLQPDLWNRWCQETMSAEDVNLHLVRFSEDDDDYDGLSWNELRAKIARYGLRHSLLIAPMPTASTAQILGNSEAFDPRTSNLYVRRVLSGEFVVWNRHLVRELTDMNCWNNKIREQLIVENGSIASCVSLPETLRERYRTVWELSQRLLLNFAMDRSPYIDQSQSLTVYMAHPNVNKLTAMLFCGWKGVGMIFIVFSDWIVHWYFISGAKNWHVLSAHETGRQSDSVCHKSPTTCRFIPTGGQREAPNQRR